MSMVHLDCCSEYEEFKTHQQKSKVLKYLSFGLTSWFRGPFHDVMMSELGSQVEFGLNCVLCHQLRNLGLDI